MRRTWQVAAGLALVLWIVGFSLDSPTDHRRMIACAVVATIAMIVGVVAFQMERASRG